MAVNPLDGSSLIGVDIGGTWVEAVVVDSFDEVLGSAVHPTDAGTPERLLASAAEAIHRALDSCGGPRVEGIGVGIPGQVDIETGVVRLAMNLGIGEVGVAVGQGIADRIGVPTSVENDVRAAAVGAYEALRKELAELRCIAYLNIGTGISAGLVLDGRLHRGRDGMAGEVGHVVVAADGPLCLCGLNGCLEAVAAGPAIQKMWPSEDSRPAEGLFGAAAAGDREAGRLADALTAHLAEAVQWLALAYGPDLVVLGGGVGSITGPLLGAIRDRLGRFADSSEVARRLLPPDRVTAMPEGFPTGAVGAAAIARQRLLGPEDRKVAI